jgi:glycosyltransferase involved in cell wall biosynthesis
MKQIKILLIGDYASFGGTNTYFKKLIDYYLEKGFEIKIALDKKIITNSKKESENINIRYIEIEEITSIVLNILRSNFLRDWLKIRKITKHINPDLLVISTGSPGKYLGCFLLQLKVLYILHTYPHLRDGTAPKFGFIRRLFLGLLLSKQKKILTVSAFARDRIASTWLLPYIQKLVEFIPNTAGPINSKKKNCKKNYNNSKFSVLTLGHVDWFKNPEGWIKIAKKVIERLPQSSIEFNWAGSGEQLSLMKAYIEESNLTESIKFLGYRSDVEKLYEDCDLYFQPSLIESQGLSVIDAMRNSLPCIVSKIGGLPESVIHEKTGYVFDINNQEEIVEKIIELAKNPDLCYKLGNAGMEYYEKKFSDLAWKKSMNIIHQEILSKN